MESKRVCFVAQVIVFLTKLCQQTESWDIDDAKHIFQDEVAITWVWLDDTMTSIQQNPTGPWSFAVNRVLFYSVLYGIIMNHYKDLYMWTDHDFMECQPRVLNTAHTGFFIKKPSDKIVDLSVGPNFKVVCFRVIVAIGRHRKKPSHSC